MVFCSCPDLTWSVTLTTALLMTVSRMTSSEAVRSIIGPDAENANLTPGLCDQVEADLASWENDVNGLISERLSMTKLSINTCLKIEKFSSKRLDQYYSVCIYLNIFHSMFH